jgi:DNA (cytosine-5)-methyltransferase 1
VPDHDILLAGWPCQSFSIAGRKKGFRDPRGNLFYAISNILEAKHPDAFLLENVRYLERHNQGRTFRTIRKILEKKLHYTIYSKVLNAKYYGVPHNRPRIFIAGFRKPIHFEFPPPSPRVPKLKSILEKSVPSKYYISQRYLNGLKKHRERHENKGNGFGYLVLDPDDVARALVIGGMGHERNLVKNTPPHDAYQGPNDDLGKPNCEGLRRLTPTECAKLQGFPNPRQVPPLTRPPLRKFKKRKNIRSFVFPVSDTQIYRQTAESVVVPLVKKIAIKMKEAMEKREIIPEGRGTI